jgi:hypothetical protein
MHLAYCKPLMVWSGTIPLTYFKLNVMTLDWK